MWTGRATKASCLVEAGEKVRGRSLHENIHGALTNIWMSRKVKRASVLSQGPQQTGKKRKIRG